MGQARQRGTLEQRVQAALQEQQRLQAQQQRMEQERRQQEHRQERVRYDREVEEFGEEKADERWETRKRQRLNAQVTLAGLMGMAAGMMMPQRPRPQPQSLEDFLNHPSTFLGES